ncbi:hypothetical protein [Pseudanabaena sp. FACHB-2040]|uniref:hypothetical protein n=1 Tax=Pseudanabaena sp. FACHB-2040 TaxID=2692859 RepID=UPI001689DAFE|nr:hypothetical protein [Pseudanabaena sp. FACHB-2040]MBD2259497.1 hypothetical protein [Pseudanabaena sp. FACHB-2040]
MKMTALKERVHQLWKAPHKVKRALPLTHDDAFEAEMRKHCDLRCKGTWQQLFAIFSAKFLSETNGDNQFLIEFHLAQCSQKEGWADLVSQVLRSQDQMGLD